MTMLLRFVVKNGHLGHFTTKNMITNLKLYKSHVTFMTRRFAPCRMSKSWRNAPRHVARYNHGAALRGMSHVADERWRFAPCRMSHEKSYTSGGDYFLPCFLLGWWVCNQIFFVFILTHKWSRFRKVFILIISNVFLQPSYQGCISSSGQYCYE